MSIDSILTKQSDVTKTVTQQQQPRVEVSQVPVEAPKPSTLNVLRSAYSQYNFEGQIQRMVNTPHSDAVQGWDWESNKVELTKDVKPEWHDELISADSLEEARIIREQLIDEQERLDTIKQGGLTGTVASIGFMLADPTMFVGLGAVVKAGKAVRIAKAIAAGAGTGFAPTALASYANAETDASDVMLSTLAGAAIGGGLGSLSAFSKESSEIIDRTTKSATKDAIERHASAAETRLDSRMTMTGTEEEILAEATEWSGTNKIKRGSAASQVMDSIADKFGPSFGKTDSTNLWNSKSAVAHKFTHDMAESGSGLYARSDTAAQIKDLTERRFMSHFMPDYGNLVKQNGKLNGIKGQKQQAKAFNRDLRIELENMRRADIDGTVHVGTTNPHVAKAADQWQAMADDVLDEAAASGVRGFDEITRIKGYVPLHWDGAKLRSLSQPNFKAYNKLLVKGYRAVGMDDEVARKIAAAVLDRTGRKELRLDSNVSAMFSGDAAAELKTLLGEEQFEAVAAIVKGKADDAGKAGAAKSRTDVDLTATDRDGRSLIDIVNNDLQFVGSKYSQEMAGRVSLARKGVKSEADYNRILEVALKEEAEKGGSVELLRASMDSVYNQLLSRPQTGEGVPKGMRRFMDFASISMLGAMGMAQLAEYGPILAQVGIKNVLRDLPILNAASFRANVESDLLIDLQSLMGKIGQEEVLYSPFVRLEDAVASSTSKAVNEGFAKLDDLLAKGTQLNGTLSGNNAIKRHQQRMAVTLGASKAVRLIKSGAHESNKYFDEIGLNANTVKEIQKRIESGDITFNGDSLDGLNLAGWSPAAGQNFAVAMNRHMNQVVQKSLAGENSYWMGGTMGKMMTQFRNYPMAAMGKQLNRSVRQGAGTASQLFIYSTVMATLAYNIKNAVQMKDTSDRSTSATIAGIMQLSSPAGLLPDAASLTMGFMGMSEYQSRYGEYSNPVISLFEAGMQTGPMISKTIQGKALTRGDINTIQTLIPFSNITGMSAILNQTKQGR